MFRTALPLRLLVVVPFFLAAAALLGPGRAQTGKETAAKDAGKEITNSLGMKLVRIPAGKFMMGSPAGEKGRRDHEKQHEVEITKEFCLGVHEVTQKQFKDVMGFNPSYFSNDGTGRIGVKYGWQPAGGKASAPVETSDFPVENVSWDEAVEFCTRLTALAGGRGRKYRLPTEAEWEHACRGGDPSYHVFHSGNALLGRQANFDGTKPYGGASKSAFLNRTCKVGSYEKNRFGLYDMHGNVWEWCADWYAEGYYRKSPPKDPPGPPRGVARVDRGGGWYSPGQNCRSASRDHYPPGLRYRHLGFRVALVPAAR
jgi:formylglycine-generating enzyme required for sulfatase activity